MSHQTQARSRNTQHAIADNQNKPPQTSNMRQSRTQPTNKQPSGHTATRIVKHPTKKQGNPATAPNRHSHGASRHRLRPSTDTHGNHTPTGSMFPSRAQCANHGPATGEREPPERAHTGRAHPDDAESRPNMAETRKREKHTPRPPEQRRGSPNRQEHEPQRTAEESNLTHNHVSEPISSRTQQPCWITVQKRGNKHGEQEQRAKTRNKNPRTNRHKKTHPAAAPTTGLHAVTT